jgi:hypothetical protein
MQSMNRVLIIFCLFLITNQGEALNYEKIMAAIEHIKYDKKEHVLVQGLEGIFDENDNLWLSWGEYDRRPKDWRESITNSKDRYAYWYIQKFNSIGTSYFAPVLVAKTTIIKSARAYIYKGNNGDVYSFPHNTEYQYGYRIERVDKEGNHYTSDIIPGYRFNNMFIDSNGIMYVYARAREKEIVTKYEVGDPLPLSIEKIDLPNRFDEEKYGPYYENYPYCWLSSDLVHCEHENHYIVAFYPLEFADDSLPEDRIIKYYRTRLVDFSVVDTSSFAIQDALHKRIHGCKLTESALLKGDGDTLILYLPSTVKNHDVVYVCKILKDGTPILSESVIDEEVRNFDKVSKDLHKKIEIRGALTGDLSEPVGMMIYGFDKSGNLYYYVWDKSDDFWK